MMTTPALGFGHLHPVPLVLLDICLFRRGVARRRVLGVIKLKLVKSCHIYFLSNSFNRRSSAPRRSNFKASGGK